jgi:hypothetical protein
VSGISALRQQARGNALAVTVQAEHIYDNPYNIAHDLIPDYFLFHNIFTLYFCLHPIKSYGTFLKE